MPKAAVVPKMVASTDATSATMSVLINAPMMAWLRNNSAYHLVVKPVQVAPLLVLNEKTIRIRIGIYRKAKQMPVYMREKVFFI